MKYVNVLMAIEEDSNIKAVQLGILEIQAIEIMLEDILNSNIDVDKNQIYFFKKALNNIQNRFFNLETNV